MLEPGEEYHDLATLIRRKAAKNGSKPAIRVAGGSLSYAELDDRTNRIAAGLARAGFHAGDRLATLLFNGTDFLELWFASAKLGVTFVPLNTALKGELLRYELADAAPRGLVVDTRLMATYASVRASLPPTSVWEAGAAAALGPPSSGAAPVQELGEAPPLDSSVAPKPSDAAAILYTSGTTGPPKGAIIPHEQMLATALEVAARSRLAPDAVLFTGLPLFHCNAQEMTTLPALLYDLSAAFDERFHASSYWETARGFGATHVSLLISMINVLYKQPGKASDRGHGVRVALTAGTTASVWPEFEQRFGLSILELYGMTECGCTTLMNPPDAVRVGSVGTPLGFVDADVVDDDDRPVPVETRGELVVRPRRASTMFSGYLNKPEETRHAWKNAWFHTGDYVRKDADGYYYFIDRKKDVIRRRGENLAPHDVESALNRHPAVFESVVVGVPSPLGEEDVKAFVQLKPGATASPSELFQFCIAELPYFMVPRYLEFLEEIPKTANQKAQRFVLRQRPPGTVHDREALGIRVAKP
ncbi:MAG: AMP-binding protein [Thermoplasmata archaeon]|nr:AMP-binding protein [Thermoplasmata archaeon]